MRSMLVVVFVSVTGCAFIHPVSAAEAAKFTETVVYSFCANGWPPCSDGAFPEDALKDVEGALYGTTYGGGAYTYGTLFAVDPATGAEQVLYSFGDNYESEYPQASVIDVKGTLYGTTHSGGQVGDGIAFSFDLRTGAEATVYSFCGKPKCKDGIYPDAAFIEAKGRLYSITNAGGAYKGGTVFLIDPKTHAEKVLHSFGRAYDGRAPTATLISVNDTLYGTTSLGGASYNAGTVFSLDPATGAETMLHGFGSGQDGVNPYAGLLAANGMLYGTTWLGGARGKGTVFAIDPDTGSETVLHSFGSGSDGTMPYAALINVNGMLYGTTSYGGANDQGTVFAIDPSTGDESVAYSFLGGSDGANPYAGLIDVKGTLYGTTQGGGAYGYGTVFALTMNH